MKKTDYDVWVETFKPKLNPFNADVMVQGCMLETFGDELALVQAAMESNPGTVWTLTESDEDEGEDESDDDVGEGPDTIFYIGQGYHFVNRMGYLITEIAYDPNNAEHVKLYGSRDIVYD